jgi:hypothetical protein
MDLGGSCWSTFFFLIIFVRSVMRHGAKGVFRMLWDARWEYVQSKYPGWLAYAWCKPASLPLLLEKGFDAGEMCTYVEKIV